MIMLKSPSQDRQRTLEESSIVTYTEAEILRIENLTKEYKIKKDSIFEATKYFKALDDVSLTVNRNEIFAWLERLRKSTLGKAILKLIKPTSGKIYFEGKDIETFDKKELFDYQEKGSNGISRSIFIT